MTEPTRPHNPARRRLAKGALATPAVLASLTSRNALAGNYHCSMSGKTSNHASRKREQTGCKDVGWSCDQWKQKCKGSTKTVSNCLGLDYKGKTEKASYGRPQKLMRANYSRSNLGGWGTCTVDQMLNGVDDTSAPVQDRELVLAGLCAYLNAEQFGRQYHVTKEDAQDLFLGALGRKTVTKSGKVWSQADCREHLMTLYF